MNFTTDLPKNDPICSYLVAKSTDSDNNLSFRMHVVVNSQEYSVRYRNPDILKKLRSEKKQTNSKLLPEDRDPIKCKERMVLCHVKTNKKNHKPVTP